MARAPFSWWGYPIGRWTTRRAVDRIGCWERDASFEAAFGSLVEGKRDAAEEVGEAVGDIIAQVRRDGDQALMRLTTQFDGFDPKVRGLAVDEAEQEDALASVPLEAWPHEEARAPSDTKPEEALGL